MDGNEPDFKDQFKKDLLGALIGKYEQSQAFVTGIPGKQRPQLAMRKSPFMQDYSDEMDYRKRQWMNEVLLDLEHNGLLELQWVKFRERTEIEKIYLRLENLQLAYERSGIMPLRAKLDHMREVLKTLADHPWSWVRSWRESADAALLQGKSVRLDVDDPEGYADLVSVLQELAALEGQLVSIRIFSQRLFRDSKHLEQKVLKRLVGLAKQASGEYRDTEEEWLDFLGLSRNPQSVWLCGPLTLKMRSGNEVNTSVFPGGTGLSRRTIEEIEWMATPAKRVLTIENLTTYHQWIEQHAGDLSDQLVVYTGGYPHRVLQMFFTKLAETLSCADDSIEIYHWGDIDLGGIRIFEYIKNRFFPTMRPFRMGVDTLLTYETSAAVVSDDYAEQIRLAIDDPQYANWLPVLETMLTNRIRLEQESISD